eukprot:276218_1
MATEPVVAMEFETFSSDGSNCFGKDAEKQDIVIKKCDHLYRLLTGLKYYSLLNISNNALSHNLFTEFCINIYKNALNDYIHIISIHSHQLEIIIEILIKTDVFGVCTLSKCHLFQRHYR